MYCDIIDWNIAIALSPHSQAVSTAENSHQRSRVLCAKAKATTELRMTIPTNSSLLVPFAIYFRYFLAFYIILSSCIGQRFYTSIYEISCMHLHAYSYLLIPWGSRLENRDKRRTGKSSSSAGGTEDTEREAEDLRVKFSAMPMERSTAHYAGSQSVTAAIFSKISRKKVLLFPSLIPSYLSPSFFLL